MGVWKTTACWLPVRTCPSCCPESAPGGLGFSVAAQPALHCCLTSWGPLSLWGGPSRRLGSLLGYSCCPSSTCFPVTACVCPACRWTRGAALELGTLSLQPLANPPVLASLLRHQGAPAASSVPRGPWVQTLGVGVEETLQQGPLVCQVPPRPWVWGPPFCIQKLRQGWVWTPAGPGPFASSALSGSRTPLAAAPSHF